MNRRVFISACTAAAVAPLAAKPDMWHKEASAHALMRRSGWITIAHPGENLNRHTYSPEALQSMCDGIVGKPVLIGSPGDTVEEIEAHRDGGQLKGLAGIVSASRRGEDGSVDVQVKWFSHARTAGMELAPNGTSNKWARTSVGFDAPITITEITPESLTLTGQSAFERATQL